MDDNSNPSGAGADAANEAGLEALFGMVYGELRRLADGMLRSQRPGHTLQPTALVNEAYMKLARSDSVSDLDRGQVMALAATAMRQILVDHARGRKRQKRGGDWRRITLTDPTRPDSPQPLDMLILDDALNRLAELSERKAKVVELRCFAGMGNEEVAAALGVSRATVAEDWRFARAWLTKELRQEQGE